MVTELGPVVRQIFDAFDRQDFGAVSECFASDIQAVEEIERRWMRGARELTDYFTQLGPLLSDVRSDLKDLKEVTWADAGMVTCWLEQTYVLDGQEQRLSAPTTMVFRREQDTWKVVLIHSIPLAEG